MSRLRKVDRAILALNEPLDSQDQELVIRLLQTENNEKHIFYRKVMVLAIVAEILPLAHAAKSARSALVVMLSILSSVLLVASAWYGNRITRVFWLDWGNSAVVGATAWLVWRKAMGLQGLFLVVLVANLVTVVLLRQWHRSLGEEVQQLQHLRYKYKNV